MNIVQKILERKKNLNALILAHNYQIPEIQDIADFVGDSLELSRSAKETDKDIIVFCGVRFMAETAKILSPDKVVLIPEMDAGCPLADTVKPEDIRELRERYPDATFVAYINTSAEVKAEVDICCTSSNALKVVESAKTDKVVFLPDKNLGSFVKRFTKKELIIWDGSCPIHNEFISKDKILRLKEKYPDAKILVHPECPPEVIDIADEVASTSGIIRLSQSIKNKRFIIGTEEGILHRLKKENPEKEFFTVNGAICVNMKKINLDSLLNSLEKLIFRIELKEDIIKRARESIEKMLNL